MSATVFFVLALMASTTELSLGELSGCFIFNPSDWSNSELLFTDTDHRSAYFSGQTINHTDWDSYSSDVLIRCQQASVQNFTYYGLAGYGVCWGMNGYNSPLEPTRQYVTNSEGSKIGKCKGICVYGNPIDGGWSEYSEWSSCTVTCGGGTQSRKRNCTNPVPAHGGAECTGNDTETQACSQGQCPSSVFYVAAEQGETCNSACENESASCLSTGHGLGADAKFAFELAGIPCKDATHTFFRDHKYGYQPYRYTSGSNALICSGWKDVPETFDCTGTTSGGNRVCPCQQ